MVGTESSTPVNHPLTPSRHGGRGNYLLRHIYDLHRIHHHRGLWPVVMVACDSDEFGDDVLAFHDMTEDGMAVIQPSGGRERNEELAAVSARAGVGHGQFAWRIKPHALDEFIFELITGPARAGPQRATSLDHEFGYDAMEGQSIIEGPLGGLARPGVSELFRSCRETNKILHSLWGVLRE